MLNDPNATQFLVMLDRPMEGTVNILPNTTTKAFSCINTDGSFYGFVTPPYEIGDKVPCEWNEQKSGYIMTTREQRVITKIEVRQLNDCAYGLGCEWKGMPQDWAWLITVEETE